MLRLLIYLLSGLIGLAMVALGWAWQGVRVPAAVEPAKVQCDISTHRVLQKTATSSPRKLKVLSFNVQYMAGKSYVFFYDVDGGPDTQPQQADIDNTTQRVADIIRDENPDIVLIQEINDANDSRTHFRDQLTELQAQLHDQAGERIYPCHADAHYWQADFIPHPKIWGPVSMKLSTLSKYPIHQALRHQLPLAQNDPISERFYFYRAMLETLIELPNGERIVALNTHFDAWGEGTGVMQKQVKLVHSRLKQLDASGTPWVLGGDLNLLPPDGQKQWEKITESNTGGYDQYTAIKLLYDNFQAVPSLLNLADTKASRWYTHYPNNPTVTGPDRTIDYLFYSHQWHATQTAVRQHDTLDVSDHLPVSATLVLSETPQKN